jgi:hypothetical protein
MSPFLAGKIRCQQARKRPPLRMSLIAHDLDRPSFARRSGLREGGKPVPIPDQVEDMLFGIMRLTRHNQCPTEGA